MLTLTVTNPIWVVKTRLCLPNTSSVPICMQYSGLSDGLTKLYRHEGFREDLSLVFGVPHMVLCNLCFMKNLRRPMETTIQFLSTQNWYFLNFILFVIIFPPPPYRDHLHIFPWLLLVNCWQFLSHIPIKLFGRDYRYFHR